MSRRASTMLLALLLSPALALAANPVVRVATPLGSFDIELCSEISEVCEAAVPNSVDNFLGYVDRGDYVGSMIHRSTTLFSAGVVVIQGGGFRREGPAVIREVPPQPAIANEFHQSNRRGTVAYARSNAVDSARSQWFVNVSNSNTILDSRNGGFTVFGVVIGDGMEVVDAISQRSRLNIDAPEIDPLFDPSTLISSFREVPVSDEFFARFVPLPEDPLPPLEDFANAFVSTDVTRVPEPAAGLGGATAMVALAASGRRLRTA